MDRDTVRYLVVTRAVVLTQKTMRLGERRERLLYQVWGFLIALDAGRGNLTRKVM